MRSGDISRVASVDYCTTAGSAIDTADFIPAVGTLVFEKFETIKTIKVESSSPPHAIARTDRYSIPQIPLGQKEKTEGNTTLNPSLQFSVHLKNAAG